MKTVLIADNAYGQGWEEESLNIVLGFNDKGGKLFYFTLTVIQFLMSTEAEKPHVH